MHRKFYTLTLPLLACLAGLTFPANAQNRTLPAKAPASKPAPAQKKGLDLKDGERFIFIGDSITHQCLYTQYVEDFFFTRYPNKRIHFRNAGVSGDRAQDALDRFDDDIASFKPTIATILLGMNDGSYADFNPDTFKTYADGMARLMDQLDAIKCRVIVMSPTMFDHQAFEKMVAKDPARGKNKNPQNYNAVLAYYGKWLQETARKRGYLFVDLFGPLNTHTVQQRVKDPEFTLIPDAIHPEADGQLVMAYELLRQTGELGGILNTGVRLVNGKWSPLNPALIKDIAGEPGRSASYTFTPKSLPWVVPADAKLGFTLTRAGHTGTQESHRVIGLSDGRYDLVINGQPIGIFDERLLAVHAEVQENPASPTHQQALRIAELNAQRNKEAIHPLRNLYGQRKGKLRSAKQANNMADFETWWSEAKVKEAELVKKARELEDEIYRINKPAPLKVEVKAAAPAAAPKPAKPAAQTPTRKAA